MPGDAVNGQLSKEKEKHELFLRAYFIEQNIFMLVPNMRPEEMVKIFSFQKKPKIIKT